MRKFIFSLKSLVMTLALVVGGSAWAQIASLPFVADFSSGEIAPFTVGSGAFVATLTDGSDAKVIAANNGGAYAQFDAPYVISNMEEVTVSFQMLNGWLGSGAGNKFAILNSEGVALASISYDNKSCNITEVFIDNSMVDDFTAFNGQSSAGAKGANGYDNGKGQGFKLNTAETKYNAEVTIKINSFGGISVSIVGGKNNNNVTYSRAAQPGTKLDLDKVYITNASNNGDRATGYYGLKIESKSMVRYSNDYSDEVVTWTTATGGRYTPIIQDGYITVDQGSRNNNGTTITSTETEGKVAAGESFTMSCRVKLGASNGQTATAFNIYDAANSAAILSFAEGAAYATAWTINGGTQTATVSAGNKGIDDLAWIDVKVTSIAGGKTYLTLKDAEGNIIDGFDKKDIPTLSTEGGLGKMNFVTSRYNANFAIDDIIVRDVVESEDIPSTPIYTYTVKFVDQDGNEFKDASVREEYAEVELAITDEDKETVTIGKSQYTYDSDDAAGQTAAADGSTVITVNFNKTTVADYTVSFVNGEGIAIKDAVTHKNALVGSTVTATAGEISKMLIDGVFYEYASGNTPLVVSENESENTISLVFAPVAGVTGYFYNNYEDGSVDWTAGTGGRYTPINADGSRIPARGASHKEMQPKVDPETGEPVTDPETGEIIYEEVDVPDPDVPFGNVTRFLTVDQNSRNNNGGAVNKASLAIDQANFTLEAKLILGSSNNQNGTNLLIKNFAGDANILKIAQKAEAGTTNWIINDDAENFTVVLPNTGTYTGGDLNNLSNYIWYNLKVTVYNGVTFLTITDEANSVILEKAQIPTQATTYGVGAMQFNSSRYYANFGLDDVTVRSVDTEADIPEGSEFVAVKINYVNEAGDPVKPADEANFQVGAPIELNAAFTADFKVDADGNIWTAESESAPVTKWIYVEDNSADVEAAFGAQVNIVFRGVGPRRVALRYQIQKADGTITAKDDAGKNLSFFYDSNKTGDYLFEKDILTVYYPYYLLVDGLLYKTGNNSGGTDKIELEIEPGTGTQAKSPVTWTPATETVPVLDEDGYPVVDPETEQPITRDEQISNAIFAQETENIEGITPVKDGYTQIRMANGAAGSAIGGNVLIANLEPGTYTITSATRSGLTNFLAGGKVVFSVESSGTVVTATSEEITVDQVTPLYIEEQSAVTKYNDYVLIRQLSSIASYPISVAVGIENGTVEAPAAAAAGATVAVSVTPADGYEVASYSVTNEAGEEIEAMYDAWDGVVEFEMPDEPVFVGVTFQQAYVKLSDYAVASEGIVEPDGATLVTGTFQAETAGSYSELFFGDVVFDIAVVPAEGEAINAQITADDLGGNIKGYVRGLVPGTEYTVKLLGVHANDYISFSEVFTEVAEEGQSLAVSDPFTAVQTYEIAYAEIENGVVTGPKFAAEGQEVALTVDAVTGYVFESISVTGQTENIAVPVSADFKFTMPADGVTVNATFAKKKIYIETDLTSKFNSLATTKWQLSSGQVGWAAPQVTTNSGLKVAAWERYAESCNWTGDIMYSTVEGLAPGTYKIELYGAAAFTFGRGFGSTAFTGDFSKDTSDTYHENDAITEDTGVTLYAETAGGKVANEIPIWYATNFNTSGIATATLEDVIVGEDGKIKIGLSKTSTSTNWHVVQLKGVTAQVLASDVLADAIARAEAVEKETVPAALYAEIESTVAIYDQAYETADEYVEAINAINAVTDKAEGYAPLAAALKEGDAIKANIAEGNPQIATYDAAIAEVKAAYEAVDVADIPAAVAVVNAAITPEFVKAQSAPGSDMTRAIVNPTINGTSGWTCERPKGGGGPELPAGGALEYWAGSANPRAEGQFDYYQVIEGLPSGKYVVSAEMYNSLNDEGGEYTVFAPTSGVYASSGNDETATLVDVEGTTYNRYETEEVIVMDGTLRLGVKNTELPMAARWFVADNFTLTLVEAIPTYPIYYADGMVGGIVTGPVAAAEGAEVELTVAPADGYELASISVANEAGEEQEVEYDPWEGTARFEMPAEAVYVSATFQEAYVKVSNFALASDGHIDVEDGTVKVTGTYDFEVKGSYSESFFGEVIYDVQITGEGLEEPIEVSLTGDEIDGEVGSYVEGLVKGTQYTANLVGVHVWDYNSFTEIFKVEAEEDQSLASVEFTAVPAYNIYYADGMVGGLVSGPTSAYEGDEVELTVAPEEGYELASISVKNADEDEIEVMYDAWDGVAVFEMPAEAVYVSVTFQEAYVKVSDFAVASDGIIDEDGVVKVTGTYNLETKGSYSESFFGEVVYDLTIVTDGAEPFTATLNDDALAGEMSSYVRGFEAGKEYTVYVDSVHVWDYASFSEIYCVKAEEGAHLTSTTFTTTQPAIAINLNVERYTGLGYNTTEAEVDFAEAKEFLGVEEITTDMLRVVNPDGTLISDYAQYDGWFDGDGVATTWGGSTKINVKFFEAIPEGTYSICDMNGADIVGDTYTAKWALVANGKQVTYNVDVTFVKAPAVEITVVGQVDAAVEYATTDASYTEKVVALTTDQKGKICETLGLTDISEGTLYGYNPSDEEFIAVFAGYDGWRDKDGDFSTWSGTDEVPACVKYDGGSLYCYNINGCEPQTIYCYWAIVNADMQAVLIKVAFTYIDPTGIDELNADEDVKADGKYIEDGKVVIYKAGIKYNAAGTIAR